MILSLLVLILVLFNNHERRFALVALAAGGTIGFATAVTAFRLVQQDLQVLISQGSASGYSAVLVLALYIDSATVRAQYRSPELIWLISPPRGGSRRKTSNPLLYASSRPH